MTSPYFRKLNFSDELHTRIFNICRKVNKFVLDKHPDADDSDYWGLTINKHAEIASYIDFEHHKNDVHYPLKATYEDALIYVPELQILIEEFNLEPYFGKAVAGNWGTHKHVFSPESRWNMCVFDTNTENTVIRFHELVDKDRVLYDPTLEYFYDHLQNDETLDTTCEIFTNTNDIYSLNVWNWHSFYVPEHKKTDTYLFYFKNTVTETDIDNVIERLKKYD